MTFQVKCNKARDVSMCDLCPTRSHRIDVLFQGNQGPKTIANSNGTVHRMAVVVAAIYDFLLKQTKERIIFLILLHERWTSIKRFLVD